MKTAWIDDIICYDGTQLCSHWIYRQTRVLGDAAVAFIGPADVSTAHLVDLVDVQEDAPIFSRAMLHVIAEHFDADLPLAIARQRLLVVIAGEELARQGAMSVRRGDDLFCGEKKLSVSIATASPVSALIHVGINIESEGTPVPTRGLADLTIEARPFGQALLARYAEELDSMAIARCKVRAVR